MLAPILAPFLLFAGGKKKPPTTNYGTDRIKVNENGFTIFNRVEPADPGSKPVHRVIGQWEIVSNSNRLEFRYQGRLQYVIVARR